MSDLGRSASGTVARPGFERLVAWLCAGEVGAVLYLDAFRLARNGRDWHHLLELCGLIEARLIPTLRDEFCRDALLVNRKSVLKQRLPMVIEIVGRKSSGRASALVAVHLEPCA
jgi:hypothetical protein